MIRKAFCAIGMIAILGAAAAAAPQGKLLNDCETLGDGTRVSYGRDVPETRLEIATDKAHVTQGKGALHVRSMTKPEPNRSKYAGFFVPIPTVDLDGKVLVFDASTDTPETTQGFYVRGRNARGKIVVSWLEWKNPLGASPSTFMLAPGKDGSGLRWEQKMVEAPGEPIRTLEFIVGCSPPDKPIDLYIDNIRLLDAATLAAQPLTIHDGENLERIKVTSGAKQPGTVLETNTRPEYVSQGKGSIHLKGRSPDDLSASNYLAFDIAIPPTSLEGKAIVFDAWSSHPEVSNALYVRVFNGNGKVVASWMSWGAQLSKKHSIELVPGQSSFHLSWEKNRIEEESLDDAVRVRFYTGTRKPGVDFDLFVDNIVLAPFSGKAKQAVDRARKLYPETLLAEGGKATCIIVSPDDKEYLALADRVAEAVARASGGAKPAVRKASEVKDADLHETAAVCLGNVINNWRLLYCYSHSQVFADEFYPGAAGGYDVRTVQDPWGTGKNLVSLGASDLEGARRAVEVFEKKVAESAKGGRVALPHFLETRLTGAAQGRFAAQFDRPLGKDYIDKQKESAAASLEAGIHCGLFNPAAGIGLSYALTRRPEYAHAFVWLIQEAKRHHDTDPKTFGGPWGMDSDFRIFLVMPAWKEVEECPELSEEDRLDVARILYQWVGDVGEASATARGDRVRFNHQTFPAVGLMHAGHYYGKYHDAPRAERWLQMAARTFDKQMTTTKPHCDCNSYQWHTLHHTFLYGLGTQNLTYFENGNARRNADYATLTMNNMGRQVAYGDMGTWGSIGGERHILHYAEWYYRDGRALWTLDLKERYSPMKSLGEYVGRVAEPARPDDLAGVVAWAPVPKMWYDSFLNADRDTPQEKTFDKVSMREGFDIDDAYMLLDGLTVGGHGNDDANAILQWYEDGRIWLADGDYTKGLPKHHCGVLILKDGQSAPIPKAASLDHAAELPSVGVSRTTLRDYSGVDWARNVVWLKGRAFAVVDQMTAHEPADYSFRAIWQSVGIVENRGATMDIEQQGRFARLAMTPDALGLMQEDAELGENWASYPYLDDAIVHVMQGIVNAKLKKGESAELFSLMQSSGDQKPQAAIVRVAPNAAVCTGIGEPTLIAAGRGRNVDIMPGLLGADATILVVSPSRIAAFGARSMTLAAATRKFERPTDIEIDLNSGKETVLASDGSEPTVTEATHILDADAVAKAIDKMLESGSAAAAPPAPPQARPLRRAWQYAAVPDRFLLSNNGGVSASLGLGPELRCSPEPLEANVFSQQPGANTLSRAFDGEENGTGAAVMWDTDQEVTIDLEFAKPCSVQEVSLVHWFATSSSKNIIFQLGRMRVIASDDGFRNDKRLLVDRTDTEMHGNWGAPVRSRLHNLDAKAKALRVILTPRPGTGIYLCEMRAWGKPLGIDAAAAGKEMLDAFLCVHADDLNGDGQTEVLAGGRSGAVYCLGADGKPIWKAETVGAVRSVSTVDFRGDKKPDVVAGGVGARLYAYEGLSGKEQWNYHIKPYKNSGNICTVFPADLDGQGRMSAIVGAENWRYFAFNGAGKMRWQFESVRIATDGEAVDLDGDGKDEVVMGTIYFWWQAANPDGSKRWQYNTKGGPGANVVTSGNVTRNKMPEVLFGGEDALVQVADGNAKPLWQFHTGDEVKGLACADVLGDELEEVLAASLSFNAYCLDSKGAVLWRTDLASPINAAVLVPLGEPRRYAFAAACENGLVYALDAATGKPMGVFDNEGYVAALAPARLGGKPALAVAGAKGVLSLVELGE